MVEGIVIVCLVVFLIYVLYVNKILRHRLREKNTKLTKLSNDYEAAYIEGKKAAYKELQVEIKDTIKKVKDEGSTNL